MTLYLETSRLKLRPFCEDDIPTFTAYRSDPLVAQYQGWDAPYSVSQARKLVQEMQQITPGEAGEWYQVAIERKADQLLIGDCAFSVLAEDARQAEIGFTLARAYQGQGYATEAVGRLVDYLFADLGLHRIQANCDVANNASSSLMERLGMRREAHFVESIWFKGEWRSEYCYGLLRREWCARGKA